jgi:hypothetical protein
MDVQPYRKQDLLGYYKILDLSPNATAAEIRRAYYTLALRYHPDKNTSAEAEVMFKGIVQAYSVLSDPDNRREYDSMTYSFANKPDNFEMDMPSFIFGSLLGNIFIYGASVGIIVCPLWGWILAPTLLLVLAPVLHAKKMERLSALCCGIVIAPVTALELGITISVSVLTSVAGLIAGTLHKPRRQIEDIEDGWVNVGEE